MAVDADAAEGNIDAAQLLDQFRYVAYIFRVREYSLLYRHDEFRLDLRIDSPFHEAMEA